MGNDGGTIAKGQDLRAVYSAVKAGPLVLDDREKSLFSTCSLSSLPLFVDGKGQKVVSDHQGQLYLKEKILEHLVATKSVPKHPHISGLADLVDLSIKWDNGRMVCPVTGSSTSMVYVRPCGCVFSNRLLSEVRKHFGVSDDVDAAPSECPVCGAEFVLNYDVVMLNPGRDAELLEFNERNYKYLQLRNLSHGKKRMKRKREGRREGKRAKVERAKEEVEKTKGEVEKTEAKVEKTKEKVEMAEKPAIEPQDKKEVDGKKGKEAEEKDAGERTG